MDKPRNDDNSLIDDAEPAMTEGGSAGGNLATDVGSRSDLDAIDDPDGHQRVTKQDDIDHAAETEQERPRDR